MDFTKEYMLFRKGARQLWSRMNEEQHRNVMREFSDFVRALKEEGRVREGFNLNRGMGLENGTAGIIVDGPFAETKEALVGYLTSRARDMDDAVSCAKRCPALQYGERLELYEVNQ